MIENLSPAILVPYEKNPRIISDEAVESVAASISEYGFNSPIVIDADNVIVAGHTRLRAAQRLDLETVPCVRVRDLTPEQVRKYRLADNRLAELTGWDVNILADEVTGLDDIPGWGNDELETLRALDIEMDKRALDKTTGVEPHADYVSVTFNVPREHAREIRGRFEEIVGEYVLADS